MPEYIELDSYHAAEHHGNLYNNTPNQLRRKLGPFRWVHRQPNCGTVCDNNGDHWDYWHTLEMLPGPSGGFPLLRILKAS